MPRRGGRHFVVVPGAEQAMTAFKYEVARSLGLADKISQVGWKGMATEEVGRIGGAEVKAIMIAGELAIAERFEKDGRAWIPEMDEIMQTITNTESNRPLTQTQAQADEPTVTAH